MGPVRQGQCNEEASLDMQQTAVQILSRQYQVALFVTQPQVFDTRAWLCCYTRALVPTRLTGGVLLWLLGICQL
jgi:hypothetical protein